MDYFVISDIHSFGAEMKQALKTAGYNKKNKEHTLIVCGDVFDRGPDTIGVYKYLKSIPKSRLILIKGNHESLYLALLNKRFPDQYDFSNHTVDTFCQIAGYNIEILKPHYWYSLGETDGGTVYDRIYQAWAEIKNLVAESEITAWLRSEQWKEYYELGKYIFVHSFIPLHNVDGLPSYYIENRRFEYNPDWRTNTTDLEWYDSRWGCPYKNFADGYFKEEAAKGKVLVCGHWCVTDFRDYLLLTHNSMNTNIFFTPHLIGLDGGVWKRTSDAGYYHPQNVLVIKNNKCYNKYGEELKDESSPIIETITEE